MGGPPNRRRRRPLPLHPPPSPPLEDAAGLSPCVDGGGEASSPRGGAGRGSALVRRLGSYRAAAGLATAAVLVVVVAYGGGEGVTEMRGHGAASGGGGRGCAGPIWAREGLRLVRPVHRLMAARRPDLARLAFGGVLLRAALWCVVVVVAAAVRCWMAARRRLRRKLPFREKKINLPCHLKCRHIVQKWPSWRSASRPARSCQEQGWSASGRWNGWSSPSVSPPRAWQSPRLDLYKAPTGIFDGHKLAYYCAVVFAGVVGLAEALAGMAWMSSASASSDHAHGGHARRCVLYVSFLPLAFMAGLGGVRILVR